MKGFYEIRMHGRGGQGAKTAAQLIAVSAAMNNKNVQAFPDYGPERAGAPMRTYVRISNDTIKSFSPITNPKALIIIDDTLLCPEIVQGLEKDGLLVVNSCMPPKKIRRITKHEGRIFSVDATGISIELLKVNKPNLITVGAFIKKTKIISLESFEKAIKDYFMKKIGKDKTMKNIKGVRKAYESV